MKTTKGTWVSHRIIQNITGWTSNDMRNARRNGLVEVKKVSVDDKRNQIRYKLESVPELFIKK